MNAWRLTDPLRWSWWLRIGVGVPLILGIILALSVVISWLTGDGYVQPAELDAGPAAGYEVGAPRYFEEQRLWVVRLGEGFVALNDRGTSSACTVPWRPDLDFQGRKGWFRDACDGSLYDASGACFDGPCIDGLRRYRVEASGATVIVDLRELSAGPRRK